MNGTDRVRQEKLEALRKYLKELGSAAVAFSSGVDSTFLLKTAYEVLGDRVLAITARSGLFPEREQREAKEFCEKEGIRQIILDVNEMEIEGFCQNPKNRCYLCKKDLFTRIKHTAAEHQIDHVVEGSNIDDLGDYRPGLQAIAELEIRSPLRECGLTKAEIRELSREMGLPTWEKPSFACLASRLVYGEPITEEKLSMVERAEQFLMNLGFHQFRVRMHGMLARIEVLPEEIGRLTESENRRIITEEFVKIGFSYVTADLKGYRTGSMNEIL